MAVVVAGTPEVEMLKFAVCDPAGTVTDEGSVALALEELRLTWIPPVGAAAEILTPPIDELPPATEPGASPSEIRLTPSILKEADCWLAPTEAVICTVSAVATVSVLIENVTVDAPVGTWTEPGTFASALFDDNVTVTGFDPTV